MVNEFKMLFMMSSELNILVLKSMHRVFLGVPDRFLGV